MTENMLQIIAGVKLLIVVAFSMLYAYGGIKGKYKRRYLAPALLIGAVIIEALGTGVFIWYMLLSLPLLIGSLSLGYGEGSSLATFFYKMLKWRS